MNPKGFMQVTALYKAFLIERDSVSRDQDVIYHPDTSKRLLYLFMLILKDNALAGLSSRLPDKRNKRDRSAMETVLLLEPLSRARMIKKNHRDDLPAF